MSNNCIWVGCTQGLGREAAMTGCISHNTIRLVFRLSASQCDCARSNSYRAGSVVEFRVVVARGPYTLWGNSDAIVSNDKADFSCPSKYRVEGEYSRKHFRADESRGRCEPPAVASFSLPFIFIRLTNCLLCPIVSISQYELVLWKYPNHIVQIDETGNFGTLRE